MDQGRVSVLSSRIEPHFKGGKREYSCFILKKIEVNICKYNYWKEATKKIQIDDFFCLAHVEYIYIFFSKKMHTIKVMGGMAAEPQKK